MKVNTKTFGLIFWYSHSVMLYCCPSASVASELVKKPIIAYHIEFLILVPASFSIIAYSGVSSNCPRVHWNYLQLGTSSRCRRQWYRNSWDCSPRRHFNSKICILIDRFLLVNNWSHANQMCTPCCASSGLFCSHCCCVPCHASSAN